MRVRVVDDLGGFEALRPRWQRLHARDGRATIFQSWSWTRGWLETCPARWLVLVADDEGEDWAYLPLRFDRPPRLGVRTLRLLGDGICDYNGWLCDPERERDALAALSRHVLDHLRWDCFALRDVCAPGLDDWLSGFGAACRATRLPDTVAMSLALPATWDEYVGSLGPRGAKRLRYVMRRVERVANYRVSESGSDDGDELIETALGLWRQRWPEIADETLGSVRAILSRCDESGSLRVRVLWCGSEPMAAVIGLLDHDHGAFSYYCGGYSEKFGRFSPGRVVVAHAVRQAIEAGCRVFDFLRGDEPYKRAFGATAGAIRNVRIERRRLGSAMRRSLGAVARRGSKHVR